MIPCMAQFRYHLNSYVLEIFFPFAIIPPILHYPEFTDRYSPQNGMLSFWLHFMTNPVFRLCSSPPPLPFPSHFSITQPFQSLYATVTDPADKILVALPPPSFSHSPELCCVGALTIMSLGRFLV